MLSRICIALGACCLAVAGVVAAGSSARSAGAAAALAAAPVEPPAATAAGTPAVAAPEVAVGPSGLAAAVRKAGQAGVEWIGYTVPMVAGHGFTCCWNRSWKQDACHLEKTNQSWGSSGDEKPIEQDLAVLLRVEKGRVGRLRSVSDGCPIDPDGKRLTWLSGVSAEESLALLGGMVEGREGGKPDRDEALASIAFHAAPRADSLLADLAKRGEVEETRSQALFWISQRGAPGAEATILAAIDSDPSSEVREQGVFALSQLPDEAGTRSLLALLKRAKTPEVRRQALFWLAQSDDPRAFDALAEILER